MNKRIRTYYPAEFKLQAVQRAKAEDRSVRSLEQEMGLSPNLLRHWVQQYDAEGASAFVRKARLEEEETGSEGAELRQLRRRVAQLEEERTILKKALTLLGQDQWHA